MVDRKTDVPIACQIVKVTLEPMETRHVAGFHVQVFNSRNNVEFFRLFPKWEFLQMGDLQTMAFDTEMV